jgi:UDP-2,4-diacetamido-2,4,6-trideoxy-beta-L-altropyranose hydrolase
VSHGGAVVFRVDGSNAIGTGHVARCATLARAFRRVGRRVLFACREVPAALESSLSGEGFQVARLGDDAGSEADARAVKELAASARATLVVADGYAFEARFFRALQGPWRRLYIDDLTTLRYEADWVLNANVYAEERTFDAAPGTRFLLGPRYALLRDEFLAAREAARPPSEGNLRVLVTMGGADPSGTTVRVVDALLDEGFLATLGRPLTLRVVRGAAAAFELSSRPVPTGTRLEVLTQVQTMGRLMLDSDVIVTAGGTTCLELACVGVPAATLAIADNQRPVVEGFERRGLMRSLGWHEDLDPVALRRAVHDLACDARLAEAMVRGQRALVDGLGAARAAEALGD